MNTIRLGVITESCAAFRPFIECWVRATQKVMFYVLDTYTSMAERIAPGEIVVVSELRTRYKIHAHRLGWPSSCTCPAQWHALESLSVYAKIAPTLIPGQLLVHAHRACLDRNPSSIIIITIHYSRCHG
ncbi:unnamed protein product [Sphacelaria rigidula]